MYITNNILKKRGLHSSISSKECGLTVNMYQIISIKIGIKGMSRLYHISPSTMSDEDPNEVISSMAANAVGNASLLPSGDSSPSADGGVAPQADMRFDDNQQQQGDVQRDVVEIAKDPLPHISDFNVYLETDILQKQAKVHFDRQAKVRSRYVLPDVHNNHLKNRHNAKHLANNLKDPFYEKAARGHITKLLIKAVTSSMSDLEPISRRYRREIHRVYINKESNRSSPIVSFDPRNSKVIGSSLYGIAIGAYDAVHFVKTTHDVMDFKMQWRSGVASNSECELVLSQSSGTDKKSYKLKPYSEKQFDPVQIDKLNVRNLDNSIFMKGTYPSVMSGIYNVSGSANPAFSYTSQSSRVVSVNRIADKDMTLDGHKVSVIINNDLTVDITALYIVERLVPFFLMPLVYSTEDKYDEVLRYLSTLIYEYIRSLITTLHGVSIYSLDLEVNIIKRNNSGGRAFRDLVDRGKVVPITPLHYDMFLHGDLDLKRWGKILFYSSAVDYRINKNLFSLAPFMNNDDKFQFSLYAQDRSTLTDVYYRGEKLLFEQKFMSFNISFYDFVNELYFRTIIKNGYPEYMVNISDGGWNFGDGITSIPINPATLHPTLCKFGLHDSETHIRTYVSKLLMLHEGYKPDPDYERSQTRLCEEILDIYSLLLPETSDE